MGDTGDIGGQTPATAGDGRRLTYAQIADRLGISGEAARIMVRRRGWRRIIPNHPRGLTVVVVPDAALADEEGRRVAPTVADEPATTGDTLPGQAGQVAAGALAALETAVLSLTARAEAAERRADDAGARADRAEVRADMAERVAERARGEAREALQRAEAVEHAEADRKARGRLRRAWDGWRGR